MPQFELEAAGQPATFVRARSPEDAVRRALGPPDASASDSDRQSPALAVGEAEAGTGWQEVTVDGLPWGRVRPRDRMRFRRD